MLVFTRKVDEAIMIGDGVEVRVLHVGSDGVRLGIQAAPTIAVHRREIYDRVREENRAAAATGAPGAPQSVAGRLRSITASTIEPTS
jgi:carbon storage regulator